MRAGYTEHKAPHREPCDPRMISGATIHTGNQIFRLVPPSDEEDPQRAKAVDEILRRIKARKLARLEGPVVGE